MMENNRKKRILVCPLDWGLGHAVRCVPIIQGLIQYGAEPILAADGAPLALLKKEFPQVEHLVFPGTSVRYPKQGQGMLWTMLKQSPRLLNGIRNEHRFIEKAVDSHGIDALISDNRFGAYSKKVPSVYITHQIHIQTGNPITDWMARKQHASYMRHFNTVWIPDWKKNGLTGKLAHGKAIPGHANYIGTLSRFETLPQSEKKYALSFILSGPEPQRSMLEEKCIEACKSYPDKSFALVRGIPDLLPDLPQHITCYSLADAVQIQQLYAESDQIVCRSGYTSIMEMERVNRGAWLIPTPGQTEQEYLAHALDGKHGFKRMAQDEFELAPVFSQEVSQSTSNPKKDEAMETVLSAWLQKI